MSQKHAAAAAVIDLNSFGDGRTAAIVKESKFEAIRLVVQAGKPIPPHKVDGPITVQCLSGQCQFDVGDTPKQLSAGSWLHLAGGQLHAVKSETGAVLLITLIFG